MTSDQHARSGGRVNPTRDFFQLVPWIFLLVAVALQIQAGVAMLHGDLVSADPPAHFTTGVMLHDFLRSGRPSQPLPFAECFYIHYPKVAFGHWPPVFYVLEALWFLVFGTKITAARWLCACIAVCCAVALYRRCCMLWGRWSAIAIAALFLALPIIRLEAWRIMSDLLLSGLVFLALCSLADYLSTAKVRAAAWLVVWSSLAILTKGTGWLLLAPIAAGPMVTGRPRLYATWSFWLSVFAICGLSAPFFLWMSKLNFGYPVDWSGYSYRLSSILSSLSIGKWLAAGLLAAILAVAILKFWPRKPLEPIQTLVGILMIWLITVIGLIELLPLTPELLRYYLVLFLPCACVLCGAMTAVQRRLESKQPLYGRIFALLCCGGALLAFIPIHLPDSTSAFSRAIASVPTGGSGPVILIESDSAGEGAMIASRLDKDPSRSAYLLRGTKFLATSSWSGYQYASKYQTPAALHGALESLSPDYVVLDTSAAPTPDSRMLKTDLDAAGSHWKTVANVPVSIALRHGELLVYHNEFRRSPGAVPESIQLGPERGSQALNCKVR